MQVLPREVQIVPFAAGCGSQSPCGAIPSQAGLAQAAAWRTRTWHGPCGPARGTNTSTRCAGRRPAGGRQGTTFQVTIGGQYLDGATNAFVSGGGVRASVVEFVKPITQMIARFEEAAENLNGLLPVMLTESGFAQAREIGYSMTLLGSVSFYRAVRRE